MTDPDAADLLRREAKQIYADIRDERMELSDGTTGWIGYDVFFAESPKGDLFLRGQKGFNSGQVGIALFFAAMYKVFGEERYRRDVRETVDFLLEEDVEALTDGVPLGAVDGLGAVVYGLSALSELTGERRYEDRAREFVRSLTDETIAADEEYDLVLGSAGMLSGLLRYYEGTDDDVALERAIRCGEHLLDNRYEEDGYRVWDTHPSPSVEQFSTGMSHGSAGIALALYRLYGHTGREAFREAADEAVACENEYYSAKKNNWRSNWDPITDYLLWWAYGVLGIGLGRLASLEYHDSAVLERDVERAMAVEPRLTEHDSLMRGTAAHVDLLVELGRAYDGTYHRQAAELAADVIERKRRLGGYQIACGEMDGITNPALFLGTAGIGYELLRVLAPEEIPSVLRYE